MGERLASVAYRADVLYPVQPHGDLCVVGDEATEEDHWHGEGRCYRRGRVDVRGEGADRDTDTDCALTS